MALLGTLAEFHVDDILVLLAGTRKTGVLAVDGSGRSGRLWVDAGHLVGAELADLRDAADVVFQLLRLSEGKFAFEAGAMPPDLGAPQDVQTVLAAARNKLAEWREIERVVPSLASLVGLNNAAADDGPLSISAEEWRTVAAIGGGGTAADVASRLGLGEFDACKAIKAVVDAQLAVVTPVVGHDAGAGAGGHAGGDLVNQLAQLRH
jgi:hypothetical protein